MTSPFKLASGFFLFALFGRTLASEPLPTFEIEKTRSAKATRVSKAESWRLVGKARMKGSDQGIDFTFAGLDRFCWVVKGSLPQASGSDGVKHWMSGGLGPAHREEMETKDSDQLLNSVITGAWALEASSVTGGFRQGKSGIEAEIRIGKAVGSGLLVLDPVSFLPVFLQVRDDSWFFGGYQSFGKRTFPTSIKHVSGGQTDQIDFQTVQAISPGASDFAMPKLDPSSFEFTSVPSAPLEIKRVAGLIFVHPKLDSQDVGWFFLDTGADVMCLDTSVAERLNLEPVGSDSVSGAVAVAQYNYGRAKSLQLGPLTLNQPTFLELDLSGLAKALNLNIVGVCGYDLISRGVFDIDTKANTLTIGAAEETRLPKNGRWIQFQFNSNTPCMACKFSDGGEGLYRLDTGSNSFLDFHSPAVRKYGLLSKAKNLKSVNTGGAGGSVQSQRGTIDWFDFGGHRFEKPEVGLQTATVGSLSTPFLDGNIGMGLMGKFRIILDYAHERIAFVTPSP